MGGQVLDYEAKRILNQGRAEGRAQGRAEGRAQGRAEGESKGRAEGANDVCTIIQRLIAEGRTEDVQKVLVDPVFRGKLIKDYATA